MCLKKVIGRNKHRSNKSNTFVKQDLAPMVSNLRRSKFAFVSYFADVEDVKYVINYDFPNCCEDYVHRIGRTGRMKKTGTAYTYFAEQDYVHAKQLVPILEEAGQEVTPELKEIASWKKGKELLVVEITGKLIQTDNDEYFYRLFNWLLHRLRILDW